jgi:hypothetical protein
MGDGTAALSAAHRYWARLEDGMNLVAAAAIFFLMFVGVFQIIGRTVFDTAIYGYIDYMEQASALFAFLASPMPSGSAPISAWTCCCAASRCASCGRWSCSACSWPWSSSPSLIDSTFQNFLRAWQLGDSTIDIKLPVWPTKLIVPFVLVVLWVRLVLQSFDYMRLIRHPDAAPIAVPVIETIEVQAKHEIEEALGREEKRP